MKVEEAINKLKNGKKRKFEQSLEIVMNLKNIDLRKPENRISLEIKVPNPVKDSRICALGDIVSKKAKSADGKISSAELREILSDKKRVKKMVKEFDFFVADANLMPEIGRRAGPILSKRNKMPFPIPENFDPEQKIKDLKSSILIKLKDNPTIQFKIGKENMETRKLEENVNYAFSSIKEKLPRGEKNIKNVYLKLTMSKPIRVVL